jgi:ligand-binding SRPBCC domain-containing protein
MPHFVFSSVIPAPVARVFAFHQQPDALQRLTPPGQRVCVLSRTGGLEEGARVELQLAAGPLRISWIARHTECVPDRLFVDVQERGPFKKWIHRHEFEALDGRTTRLTDRVEFSLPGGAAADILGAWAVRLQLRSMFRHRHAVTRLACGPEAG